MIWYLLYPIRGTTDPPLLPPNSLIRRAFYRHGATTARHWLLAMLVSVTIGVIFIYPVVFLSDFPPGGISRLSFHVWTGSSSFESQPQKRPDLEMRQIRMHGDYMQALNKSTLLEALLVQQLVLEIPSSTTIEQIYKQSDNLNWGYHSPLMYWEDSMAALESDIDVLSTINERKLEPAYLNVSLRPMSAFAGKSFTDSRLIAADALILTLYNRQNDTVGKLWQNKMQGMIDAPPTSWSVDPSTSPIHHSRIHEYRYQPLSFRQNTALALAYGLIGLYVAASLKRLKAFRSRFGLVVTALTQMTTSILASFTICGLLGINLAQIPQEAYPFVVLTIGLENIFRLLNAVLAYPPEMPPQQRIANGLGDIGHSSLASAAQNLIILWLLSLFVSPGVSAFCAFAAVALLFDLFFLLTFFLAVLNVDIRRLELQDSITRIRAPTERRKESTERPSWLDALIRGRVPFSTRMAGSAVTISFVLALNWHFSDHSISSLRHMSWSAVAQRTAVETTAADSKTSRATNKLDSPLSGLHAHDYGDTFHFMSLVKPGAHAFTVRVFDPMVLVLNGADRSGVPLTKHSWLSAVRNIAIHHFYPFALAVVFVVAFVTVLMNFLLWDDRAQEAEKHDLASNHDQLAVKSLEGGHRLDIVRMAHGASGHILSAGLDRTVYVAARERVSSGYFNIAITADVVENSSSELDLSIQWPIATCVIDDLAEYFALLCESGKLLVGKVANGHVQQSLYLGLSQFANSAILVEFMPQPQQKDEKTSLLVITTDGKLYDVGVSEQRETIELRLREESLFTGACVAHHNDGSSTVYAVDTSGSISSRRWDAHTGFWQAVKHSNTIASARLTAAQDYNTSMLYVSGLHVVIICQDKRLDFVDAVSFERISSLPIRNARPGSVRFLHSGVEQCPKCSSVAVSVCAVVYTEVSTATCVLISYTSGSRTDELMCIAAQNPSCKVVANADMTTHRLLEPGAWETTQTQAVAGVRKCPAATTAIAPSVPKISAESPLRRRRRALQREESATSNYEAWEAYTLSMTGKLHTTPLAQPSESDTQLYATELGPVCRLGTASVGVALGNTVHIVRVGRETGHNEADLKRNASNASTSLLSRRKHRKSQ